MLILYKLNQYVIYLSSEVPAKSASWFRADSDNVQVRLRLTDESLRWLASRRAKAARKKKRRRGVPGPDYVAAIEDWEWSYSLLLNTEKHPVDPYHEFRHLVIAGRLLRPAGLKTDRLEMTLLPTVGMNPGPRNDREPLAVGSLEIYDDRIVGLMQIPTDVLPAILQMLIAERFKFIVMGGDNFRHRRALLHRFRLEMKLDEDDLPATEGAAG